MKNTATEKNLVDSLLWNVLETHLNHQIDFIRTKLEGCSSDELIRYQATIKAYRQIIGLKDTILEETSGSRRY